MPTVKGATTDCDLNYVRTGSPINPLVILVHAVGLDLTYWGDQIEAFSGFHDVVAYDLRGHGASSRVRSGYGFDTLALDLAALIRHLDRGAADIVGLSVGGMIAQTLAIEHPALVRRLVLLDTVAILGDAGRAGMRQRAATTRDGGMEAILAPTIERWFTPEFRARRPDVVDRVTKTLLGCDAEIHAQMWDCIATLDVGPALDTIRQPTLVLVGEKDPTTPVAASQYIADRIARSRMVVLPGASHLSPIEVPHLVNDELTSFLAE